MNDTMFDPGVDTPVDLSKYDEDYRRAKQGDVSPFKPMKS